MHSAHDQILQFAQTIQRLYFEIRTPEKLLHCFAPAISLQGFSSGKVAEGIDEASALLKEELFFSPLPYRVVKSNYSAAPISGNVFTLCGSLLLSEIATDKASPPLQVHVSAVCCLEANSVKLHQLHFSQHLGAQDRNGEERSQDLRKLTNNVPGGVFRCLFDEPLTLCYISKGFLSMFGYTREEIRDLFNDSFWEMIYKEDREGALAEAVQQVSAGSMKELEYRVVCKDGSLLWVLDKGQLIVADDGERSFYCILVDITNLKKTQEELRLSLDRHKIIMNQTTDIIFEWDIATDVLTFSSNWEKKFGYEPIRSDISQRIPFHSHIHSEDTPNFVAIMNNVKFGIPYQETEFRIQDHSERYLWCRIRATTQFDADGNPFKAVGVIVDIDNEKRLRDSLTEKAERDSLTGLYNKMTAQSGVEHYIAHSEPDILSALMILDIDNFKAFNDTMGHLFGDAILSRISAELKKQFRSSDIIGRLGGDEFIVFLKDIPSPDFAVQKACQLKELFEHFFTEDQLDYHVSCSIGISLYPENGNNFQQLYKNADLALYKAKRDGKNCCCLYDASMMGETILSTPPSSNTAIDSDGQESFSGEQLVSYVFSLLYQSNDLETAVRLMLEFIGERFEISRAYIFENTDDDQFCCNTFEWCNEGVQPEIQNLRKVSYGEDLGGNYQGNFNENGIFYCRDISELPEKQYAVLAPQGIKSMLQCAIYDNGKFKGYVGFDECETHRYWTKEQINALTLLSQILSTFLLKQRAQQGAEKAAAEMEGILDRLSSRIYAIDRYTYELLYLNHKTLELIPHAQKGMYCYSAFFNRESPCEICPLHGLYSGKSTHTMELHNPVLNIWNVIDVSPLVWDGREACLLTCYDITKYKEEQ